MHIDHGAVLLACATPVAPMNRREGQTVNRHAGTNSEHIGVTFPANLGTTPSRVWCGPGNKSSISNQRFSFQEFGTCQSVRESLLTRR